MNPSFNIRMNAELGVKNTNFGHYKFRDSTIYFSYNDLIVGEAFVPKARAKARSTKKFNVIVNLSSSNLQNHPQLGNDLNSGVLTLTSKSKLDGKVELIKVLKKKKSTEMDCTLAINLKQKLIGDLNCK
ncbi:Late [Abeliophyllum distichum]|uniref:Late n=1 Tax=Abeliophyllum distichum TaxID=126358 RepID=A0ABD1VSA4_9LAMI